MWEPHLGSLKTSWSRESELLTEIIRNNPRVECRLCRGVTCVLVYRCVGGEELLSGLGRYRKSSWTTSANNLPPHWTRCWTSLGRSMWGKLLATITQQVVSLMLPILVPDGKSLRFGSAPIKAAADWFGFYFKSRVQRFPLVFSLFSYFRPDCGVSPGGRGGAHPEFSP